MNVKHNQIFFSLLFLDLSKPHEVLQVSYAGKHDATGYSVVHAVLRVRCSSDPIFVIDKNTFLLGQIIAPGPHHSSVILISLLLKS